MNNNEKALELAVKFVSTICHSNKDFFTLFRSADDSLGYDSALHHFHKSFKKILDAQND